MSQKARCDLAASTGINDGRAVIKQLLAGAKAVQIVSTLYRNGTECIQKMLTELETWMEKRGFESVEQFRGMMSQEASADSGLYERVQFMKYFGDARDTV